MVNIPHTHNLSISESQRDQCPTWDTPVRRVRQDKGAEYRASPASHQPASAKKSARLATLNRNNQRSQKRPSASSKAEKVTIWLPPRVKAELERLAHVEALSISATGAAFLEEMIRQKLHVQHAVLLQPIIETAIRKSMQAYSNRLALLLVRVAFASEQTRALVTNILSRQKGITPELLNTILDGSSRTAKRNITTRTPQLEELIAEVHQWITKEVQQ